MKEENRNILKDGISILKIFDIKEEEIVITGSIALDLCGLLPEEHKVHDFDCFVIANKDRASSINSKIQDFVEQSGKFLNDYKYQDDPHIFFSLFGKEINIWYLDEGVIETEITYKGIKVHTPNEIIKRKLSYKRAKDYTDILDIINLLINKK